MKTGADWHNYYCNLSERLGFHWDDNPAAFTAAMSTEALEHVLSSENKDIWAKEFWSICLVESFERSCWCD